MLTLTIRYGWLNANVPQIFGDGWRSWLDNLSEYEILNLRMNRSGLEYYKRIIVDRLVRKRSNEFTNLCLICNRLTHFYGVWRASYPRIVFQNFQRAGKIVSSSYCVR